MGGKHSRHSSASRSTEGESPWVAAERKARAKEREETIKNMCIRTEVDEETGETLYFYNVLAPDRDFGIRADGIARKPRSTALMGMKWVADDSDYIELFEDEYQSWLKEADSAMSDKMRLDQNALSKIFSKLIDNNMDSLLEFYCVQELSLIDFWERAHFKQAAIGQMGQCLDIGRLHPVKIFVSYLVPSKCMTETEVERLLQQSSFEMSASGVGGDRSYTRSTEAFRKLARKVVDDGIKEFAVNIVATRECLLEMRHFPTDLVPTLLSFLFFGSVQALRRMKAPV